MKSLAEMQKEVYEWALSKGWNNPGPTFGEAIALLHSEASEALEEFRDHNTQRYVNNGGIHYISSPDLYLTNKPLGVPSEFADLLIRLLHYSALWEIDLEAEFEAKMAYNQTRPYRHGNRAL